jgi:hypothetical protein
MKFWKFQYLGEESVENCMRERKAPMVVVPIPGLETTDREILGRLRTGDGVVIAELFGEQAKIHAVGRVLERHALKPTIVWSRSVNFRQPDERSGLIHWQTKTAFEISPVPAERYGLRELVEHYVKNHA